MTAEVDRKKKIRFRIGLVLIGVSYILWYSMFVFEALALRDTEFPWWLVTSAAFVVSCVTFIVGLLLSGREAISLVRRTFARFFWRKKGPPPKTG